MWCTSLVAPRHVGSSRSRAQTHVPCIGRRILNHCTTREAPGSHLMQPGSRKVGYLSYPRHLGKFFQLAASGPWVSNNGLYNLDCHLNRQTPPFYCPTYFPWGTKVPTSWATPPVAGLTWVLDLTLLKPWKSGSLL